MTARHDDDEPNLPDPWAPWEAGDLGPPELPVLEVTVAEKPAAGVLLGPDGEVLLEVRPDRLPFGFHP